MVNITKRFTRFVWYGPDLLLANAAWAPYVNFARVINDAGTSQISYKYGRSINSYGTSSRPVRNGDILELDATSTGFAIDNGTAPSAGAGGTDTIQLDGPAGETTTDYVDEWRHTSAATPAAAFSSGSGSVQYSTDGTNWSALPNTIAANTNYFLRVQHPNSNAFSATVTLTYA